MGRRKISMEKIEDLHARQICFSKRRKGLFKKATALCNQGGGEMAILIFSSAGNLYCYGSPTVDSVVHRYFERQFVSAGGEDTRWWDVPVEGLALHELEVLHRMLGVLKEKAVRRTTWLLGDNSGEASCVCQQSSSDSGHAMEEEPSPEALISLELSL